MEDKIDKQNFDVAGECNIGNIIKNEKNEKFNVVKNVEYSIKDITSLKEDLGNMVYLNNTFGLKDSTKIRKKRRDIARMLTYYNAKNKKKI